MAEAEWVPSDDAVEAACKVFADNEAKDGKTFPWARCSEDLRNDYRRHMRPALQAAHFLDTPTSAENSFAAGIEAARAVLIRKLEFYGEGYERLLQECADEISALSPSPPTEAVGDAALNSDGDTLESLADEIAAAASQKLFGFPIVTITLSVSNRDAIVKALRSSLAPETERLRKALEFYAEQRNWWDMHGACATDCFSSEGAGYDRPAPVRIDGGDIARSALHPTPTTTG